jgi:hypothetical protein
MKKLSAVLISLVVASNAFAKHYFNVCYMNWTKAPITYNNNTPTLKWADRAELLGSGTIEPNTNKCFLAVDETIFSTDYATFYVDNKWYGVVNSGFRKPYAIAQDATSTDKKAAKLGQKVDATKHDQYYLYVHVTNDGTKLSKSEDPKDTDSYITPAKFSK